MIYFILQSDTAIIIEISKDSTFKESYIYLDE